jgi:hypothetical protein
MTPTTGFMIAAVEVQTVRIGKKEIGLLLLGSSFIMKETQGCGCEDDESSGSYYHNESLLVMSTSRPGAFA